MVMINEQGWRGVMVPPPNPLAAIGGALRHAFRVDRGEASPALFAGLLARLDRALPAGRRRRD